MITLKVSNKNNSVSAEQVLIDAGFEKISSWHDKNEFKKGGKIYGIDHPVWNHENDKKASVNIYNKLSAT